jgi:cytochrome c556
MRAKRTMFAMALALAPAWLALAAPPDPVVSERQADMKAMAAAAKSISEFFSGKKPYEADVLRSDARSIAALGGDKLIRHFADVVTADGSNARADIAADRGKFAKLAHDLQIYASQVAAAAEDSDTMPDGMRMRPAEMTEGGPFARKSEDAPEVDSYTSEHAFHMMLQTCSACHAAFRSKR